MLLVPEVVLKGVEALKAVLVAEDVTVTEYPTDLVDEALLVAVVLGSVELPSDVTDDDGFVKAVHTPAHEIV